MAGFRSILVEFCERWDASAARWRVPPDGDDEVWIRMLRRDAVRRPEQGWKLHVSAGEPFAEEVLRRVLPVLLAEDASFKVAATPERLGWLNRGLAGLSQIGKFITIYPNDDAQAVRLANALHQATRGLRGPAIPSDRPLADGSLVHYRYGGFRFTSLQQPGRFPISAIATPNGELIEDVRATHFQPPAWAIDPFERAGLSAELREAHPLVGGRYLLMGSLLESARGGVFWGVDLTGPRRVVLKRGARDAGIELDGRDARDRLRHEAAMLKRLAPDPRFPAAGELIQYDDDLYLTMEDVTGATFQKHVADRYRQGLAVPGAQVATWGRELAALLGAIHAHGLIYSDLKSTNIVVAPTGQLRLIDFDLTFDAAVENPLRGGATRGYRSPQQTSHAAPTVADDIYGLGALLYFAATGTDPMEATRPLNLLERPIALLNPAIGPGLVQVIERCLAPDAAARFSTMAELDAALAALGDDASTAPPAFGGETSQPVARDRYRETARHLGDRLCLEAKRRMSGRSSSFESVAERDLYKGSAGILLALTAVASEWNDPAHRGITAEMAQWLRAAPRPTIAPLAGLYIGEAGRAAAILRAGQILGDSRLIAAATERGHWIAGLAHDSPDLINGAAGRLRFHLLLWDETREDEHLHAAIQAGEYLIETARQVETGLCWQIPPQYGEAGGGKIYLGYAHGAAGIGDALLDLYDATGDARFLDAARGAARWLTSLAVPALDDSSGLNWPPEEAQALTHAFWCHGAAGIGKFFLRAAELNVVPGALEIAYRAARTVARGARWAELCQCHGLVGNIEFLLDIYQATGNRDYWTECESLSRLLLAQVVDAQGAVDWSGDTLDWLTADYMVGYAGLAVCLLRLSDPEHMPHQLSRQGFRVQSRLPNG